MKAKLEKHVAGTFLLSLYHDNGKPITDEWLSQHGGAGETSHLFQVDYDYPGLAESLGWDRKLGKDCDHRSTDGTFNCRECGVTVSQFISAAIAWLLDHNGEMFKVFPDDGVMQYFD